MKKSASLIIAIMLVFTSLLFTGCASVSYSTIKDKDGRITEIVIATLNEELIVESGEDIVAKKAQLKGLAHNALVEKLDNYGTRIQTLRNDAHNNRDLEKESYYLQLLSQIKISEPVWAENKLSCIVSYESEDAYLYFYEIEQPNFSTTTKKENWFYSTIYFKGSTGYALNHGLYAVLSDKISDMFVSFNQEDVSLSYSYLARSRRYHSNADSVEYTEEGYYLHSWNISSDNPEKEIYFYVRSANRSHFYLLSIIISLIVCAILCIIAIFILISKKKKRKRLISRLINL